MSDPEDVLAQGLRKIVASGAAEPWEFPPADARKVARWAWRRSRVSAAGDTTSHDHRSCGQR